MKFNNILNQFLLLDNLETNMSFSNKKSTTTINKMSKQINSESAGNVFYLNFLSLRQGQSDISNQKNKDSYFFCIVCPNKPRFAYLYLLMDHLYEI